MQTCNPSEGLSISIRSCIVRGCAERIALASEGSWDRDPGAPQGPEAGADYAGPGRSPRHAAVVANGVTSNLSQMDNPSPQLRFWAV
jgi:hypothetical protein